MKIINRKQLMALPRGTLYSEYAPSYVESLWIKGDTIVIDGNPIDWWHQDLMMPIKSISCGDLAERLDESERLGTSMAIDLYCQGRDGIFEHEQLYLVWEPEDVVALIIRLGEALRGEE